MKRVKLSGAILIIMVTVSIFFNVRISSQTKELISIVENIETSAESGDMNTAKQYAESFSQLWKKFYNEANFMITNARLSEIDDSQAKVIPLIESQNDELKAELSELKNLLKRTANGETPSLHTIF